MQPVFRQVGKPSGERGTRRAGFERSALDRERAGVERIDAEDAARDLGAARPDEARETDDLAPAELEGDVREDASPHQPFGLQHDVADLRFLLREEIVERAPHHQADDLAVRKLGRRTRGDVAPVSENGDDVGDRAHLLEAMTDVDDGNTTLAEAAYGGEEVLDLVGRERRRRLVHDQDACARRECLRDLEQLPVGDAQPPYRSVRPELGAELQKDTPRLRAHRAPVDGVQVVARMPAGEHVFCHRKVLEDGRLLVHGNDAEPVGNLRVADPLRRVVDQDLAVVGLDDAGQDLYQRRFARSVLAYECVNRRGPDRKAHVGDGVHTAVALRDTLQLDDWRLKRFAHRG